MMPSRVPQAQLDQFRGEIAAREAAIASINQHIEMMAMVQAAQRNVYGALADLHESQGAMRVSDAYSHLIDAMAKRDVFELQQLVAQRDLMTGNIAQMRIQLDSLENPSPIIGVDLRGMGPRN